MDLFNHSDVFTSEWLNKSKSKISLLRFIFWNYTIYYYILIFLDKMFYEAVYIYIYI